MLLFFDAASKSVCVCVCKYADKNLHSIFYCEIVPYSINRISTMKQMCVDFSHHRHWQPRAAMENATIRALDAVPQRMELKYFDVPMFDNFNAVWIQLRLLNFTFTIGVSLLISWELFAIFGLFIVFFDRKTKSYIEPDSKEVFTSIAIQSSNPDWHFKIKPLWMVRVGSFIYLHDVCIMNSVSIGRSTHDKSIRIFSFKHP